jgi:DNA-directed RNA polymerase subunit RPC12/RpoP
MVETVIVSYIRLWHWWYLMWTKYSYVCTNCDALIEITTQVTPEENASCTCRRGVWVTRTSIETVAEVTPPKLVKINTNPYN